MGWGCGRWGSRQRGLVLSAAGDSDKISDYSLEPPGTARNSTAGQGPMRPRAPLAEQGRALGAERCCPAWPGLGRAFYSLPGL